MIAALIRMFPLNVIETMSRPHRCLAWFDSILEICIAYIATKISKSLGILWRLTHFVPSCTLLNIYRFLTQPYISYGPALWGQAVQSIKSYLNKILILQKRALRLINFAPFKSHAIPLFDFYNVLPLSFLYIKSICII